jgi:hypothetical protein
VSGRQHNELFTMDGAILPLLSATPLPAGFANAITPLQTGAPDVAFPRLNLLSYCLFVPGGLIVPASFRTPDGAPPSGWYTYSPLTSATHSPGADVGCGARWSAGNALTGDASRPATPSWTPYRWPAPTWHGDWNYTLLPAPAALAGPPPPAPAPRPDLAWLAHPAITGLTAGDLDALTAALASPAARLGDAALARRRGYRPRQGHDRGGRPKITLAGKLLATILHDRHGLPCKAIAALFGIRHEHVSRHAGDIRRLLRQIGHAIEPSPHKLATLDDLYRHATAAGITIPRRSRQPVNNRRVLISGHCVVPSLPALYLLPAHLARVSAG